MSDRNPSRAEKVAEAQRLRAEGLKLREIGERMGVPLGTAHGWLADPDLSRQRARRKRYAGRCVDCGAPTDGSSGPAKAAVRCHACTQAHRRYWTREAIIGAIQGWADEHGEPPTATDLRYDCPGYPTTGTVRDVFGTWNEAIRAAGYEPFSVGMYGRDGEDDDLCQEIRERYEAGETPRDLACVYGCCEVTIRYRIRKVGGTLRSSQETARLRREQVAA